MATMKKIPLAFPLKRGDHEINEITIREPQTGDLRGLETFSILRMDVNTHRILVARLSDITEPEFSSLNVKDLTKIQTEVVNFFAD